MNILDHYLSAPRPRDFKRLQEAYKRARFRKPVVFHSDCGRHQRTVYVSRECIAVRYTNGMTLVAPFNAVLRSTYDGLEGIEKLKYINAVIESYPRVKA